MDVAPWMMIAAVMAGGCRGDGGGRARAEPAAQVAVAAVVDAMAGGSDANDADPMDEKQRHCPVTVARARAAVEDAAGGVTLVVTVADEAGAAEIRRRAAHLVALTSGAAHGVKHGGGEGGGFMRNCPVVVKDTRVTAEDVAGGARLTVVPAGALTAAELRTETRRRLDALANP